jgi:hypothetical protein
MTILLGRRESEIRSQREHQTGRNADADPELAASSFSVAHRTDSEWQLALTPDSYVLTRARSVRHRTFAADPKGGFKSMILHDLFATMSPHGYDFPCPVPKQAVPRTDTRDCQFSTPV